MIGSLVSFFMGYFSDKYGRKTICLIMSILMSLSIILSELFQLEILGLSINSKYVIYFISQFLIGFTSYVLYVTSYVLLLEITTTKNSTIVSNVNLYLFVVGELLALLIGYVLRNWHWINYFLTFYSILIVLMVALVLPESPRYLVTLKKYRKAYKILKRIAKVNGTSQKLLNENEMIRIFKSSVSSNNNIEQEENNPLNEQFNDIEKEKDSTLIDYLTNPLFNLMKTFILTYCWIALSMIYYGVSLGIKKINFLFFETLIIMIFHIGITSIS
jgi:MFS family permease